ncbi:hypothetical protein F5884DRAFT_797241 [Xylogone sp. PMI_703]|nr:hypothetical protein F5884DRAFT_797241 [Xylogone sp. PMI_703]
MTSNPRIYTDDSSPRIEPSAAGSSSIRPRNRRLQSTEQELAITSGTSTANTSRTASPIPSKYPSRTPSNNITKSHDNNGLSRTLGVPASGRGGSGRSSPVGFSDILETGWTSSWNALQGLANSVLGVDVEEENSTKNSNMKKKQRRPVSSFIKPSQAWGPEGLPKRGDGGVGGGTSTERDAAIRTKKRIGVLEGHEDLNGGHKRKTSIDENRPESRDDEEDALVYIHHVQQNDTLAGVVLKYNCQPAVFRKVNRLWPNDSIQVRKVVMLPVDACAIKGRPCEPPSSDSSYKGVDLLAPTPEVEEPPSNTDTNWPTSSPFPSSSSHQETPDDEPPWTHVRWVLLDSSPSAKPTEIARISRKTLGYFPPRRRKSQATVSSISSPRASTDSPGISQIQFEQTGLTSSPVVTNSFSPRSTRPASGSYFPPPTSGAGNRRRDSVAETAERLGWMQGPGGVGTFGRNVRKPGPAQDGLNSWAKKHIPALAVDSLPSSAALGYETASLGFNDEVGNIVEGRAHPLASTPGPTSTPGQGIGLENAAAAIEGWVRRLAKGPATPIFGTPNNAGTSDLIELMDGASSDDGRGFESNSRNTRSVPSAAIGSGRWDMDDRIRDRSIGSGKRGKGD